MDARVPALDYANPQRFRRDSSGVDRLHIVCPIDAFAPNVGTMLMGRIGDFSGSPRAREPKCGEVMQDIKGAAQGIWFVKGTPVGASGTEDAHLALVNDNDFNTAKQVFSVGTSMRKSGLDPAPYLFTPKPLGDINRRFADVKPDGTVHCYERLNDSSPSPVVLLTMPTDTTLRLERIVASSCEAARPWALGESFTEFER